MSTVHRCCVAVGWPLGDLSPALLQGMWVGGAPEHLPYMHCEWPLWQVSLWMSSSAQHCMAKYQVGLWIPMSLLNLRFIIFENYPLYSYKISALQTLKIKYYEPSLLKGDISCYKRFLSVIGKNSLLVKLFLGRLKKKIKRFHQSEKKDTTVPEICFCLGLYRVLVIQFFCCKTPGYNLLGSYDSHKTCDNYENKFTCISELMNNIHLQHFLNFIS